MLIGEVARLSGVSARMLRHYDRIGLVRPSVRTTGGYRDYDEHDLQRLVHVEALRSLGMPLHEVARSLDDAAAAPTELFDRLIANTIASIAREQELLTLLQRLRRQEPAAWNDVLRAVALLQRLGSPTASERQRAALAGADRGLPAGSLAEAALTEDDANVSGALQWALARSADAETVAVLTGALDSPDPAVRTRAIAALVKIEAGTGTDAESALAGALDHADPAVRARVALALGSRGDPVAVAELVAMIVHGVEDVPAAEALGTIARRHGSEDDIAALVGRQLTGSPDTESPDTDPSGTEPSDTGSSRTGTAPATSTISPDARLRLTQALGEIPGPAARRLLTTLTDDREQRVRLAARYLVSIRGDDAPSRGD